MCSFTQSVEMFHGQSSYTICHFRLCYCLQPTNPVHLAASHNVFPLALSTLQDMEWGCVVLHSCAYLAVLRTPLPCPLTVYGEITNLNLSIVLISMHINAPLSKELFCLVLIVWRGKVWYPRSDTVTTLVARIIISVLVTMPLNIVLFVLSFDVVCTVHHIAMC